MNLLRVAVVLTVFLNLTSCLPKLTIIKGTLIGQIKTSRDGRPYYSYTRVPYAEPPIGNLRFKAPQPLKPWKGILNATRSSGMCVQPNMTYSAKATRSLTAMKSYGSEDCLYLNIYYPVTDSDKLLPVMFWIHGGAFTTGHGNEAYYGPEYFMDKDVVLVSINYRLGVLGFLSTEDETIPGNFGMKDQVEALRWVRDNIIYFNGDPEQVTIFGQSSGGASVGFHLLSHMSKGLFHKAILQSGTPLCKWAITAPKVARERAFKVAKVAGCHIVDTSENVLSCLRKLPAAYLIDIHPKLSVIFTLTVALFTPVVETCDDCDDTSNDGAFLCHHPMFRFKQENFVPVIIGMNPAEGGIIVSSIYNNTGLLHGEFTLFFHHLMSIAADYNCYTKPKYVVEIGNKLMNRYFPDGGSDKYNAVQMFTDAIFGHCVVDMALKVSSPVYFYVYDYQNAFSLNTLYGWKGDPLGVTHGDELNSLFRLNTANPLGLNKNDTAVSRLMIDIWYRFAVSKKPTIDGRSNGILWKKFMSLKSTILKIDSSIPKTIRNPYGDMLMFWKKLPIGPPYMSHHR